MATEVLVDTSGFVAALNPHDEHHAFAGRWFNEYPLGQWLITTDYILDETVTLLQARGQRRQVGLWLERVLKAPNCRIVWMNSDRFNDVRRFFAKHADKDWSFTDCFSFVVMGERGISQALTADHHYQQAGFDRLLGRQVG